MLDTIELIVPKIKPRNNMEGYATQAIRRLKKLESFLLRHVNTIYRGFENIPQGYSVTILPEVNTLFRKKSRASVPESKGYK